MKMAYIEKDKSRKGHSLLRTKREIREINKKRTDIEKDGCRKRQTDNWTDKTDGQIHNWTGRQMDAHTNGWMDRQMEIQRIEHTIK